MRMLNGRLRRAHVEFPQSGGNVRAARGRLVRGQGREQQCEAPGLVPVRSAVWRTLGGSTTKSRGPRKAQCGASLPMISARSPIPRNDVMATVHDKLPAHQAQLLDALTPRGQGARRAPGFRRSAPDPRRARSGYHGAERAPHAREGRPQPKPVRQALPHQSRAAARRRAGPHHADSAFLAYIRVINREPEAVERALNAA